MDIEIKIGDIFLSNNYGDFIILEESEVRRKRSKCYNIKFLKTNSIKKDVCRTEILNGEVKDFYYPSICDVACIGNVKQSDYKKEYSCWKHMIHRCYNKNDTNYKNYGAKGVKVEDRWLCFEYYLEDIQHISGYDKELLYKNKIQLDKDAKSKENKIYSKETCQWISPRENVRLAKNQKSGNIIAISPSGEEFEYEHIVDCAKENNLREDSISSCLRGITKTHKNWSFYYKQKGEKFI